MKFGDQEKSTACRFGTVLFPAADKAGMRGLLHGPAGLSVYLRTRESSEYWACRILAWSRWALLRVA